MGLLIAGRELIVVNQNVGENVNGEILQYKLKDGSFAGTWVPDSGFAPRGAVLKNGVLYLANFVEDNWGTAGQVLAFAGNGKFLGAMVPDPMLYPLVSQNFRPRGIVVGPDGLLYVSSDPCFSSAPTFGGQVVRFDPNTFGFEGVFIDESPSAFGLSCASSSGWAGRLNSPEGLVFGSDGNLYVTSFCVNTKACPAASDIDSIRIYGGLTKNAGQLLGAINLDSLAPAGQKRATAQALLFGPGGQAQLFLPITLRPAFVGEVVSCNLEGIALNRASPPVVKATTICPTSPPFVPTGTLGVPFYLTFGRTDSASLTYPIQ